MGKADFGIELLGSLVALLDKAWNRFPERFNAAEIESLFKQLLPCVYVDEATKERLLRDLRRSKVYEKAIEAL